MTEAMKGKTREEAEQIFSDFHHLITGGNGEIDTEKLGKLAALAGVRDYPTRVKCATLCWHTLNSLLHGRDTPISTE